MNDNNPIKFRNDKEAERWSSAWDAGRLAGLATVFCAEGANDKIEAMRQRMPDPTASIKPEEPGKPITPPPNERPALERLRKNISSLGAFSIRNEFTNGYTDCIDQKRALRYVMDELEKQPEPESHPIERLALERVKALVKTRIITYTSDRHALVRQGDVLAALDSELANLDRAGLSPRVNAVIESARTLVNSDEDSPIKLYALKNAIIALDHGGK